MDKKELCIYTCEIARRAEKDDPENYALQFVDRIMKSDKILAEYEHYLNTGRFACEYSIADCTIADIIIWQMDHFKALLDDQAAMNKGNEYRMVLEGFATMMDIEDNPEPFLARMGATTGTDFVEKY